MLVSCFLPGTVMLEAGVESDDNENEAATAAAANTTTTTQIIGPDGKSLIDISTEGNTAIVFPQAPEDTTSSPSSGSRRAAGRKPNTTTTSSVDVLLPYKCDVCEYRARWPSEITQHKKNHSDEKPYRCPRCTYKSKWKWDVVKHLKRCGGGTVKDVIDVTKDFYVNQSYSPENLAPAQKRELSGGPPNVTVMPSAENSNHSADFSYENGFDEASLDLSNATTPTSLECKDCSFVASSVVELRKHARFHAYEAQQVYCSQCPFVGNNPAELKRHVRVHSDEKPFLCRTCGYSSKWKCDLKKHCKSYAHEPATSLSYGGHGRRPRNNDVDGGSNDDANASEYDSADTEYNGDLSASHAVAASEMTQLQCADCSFTSADDDDFAIHLQRHGHERKTLLRCNECDFMAREFGEFLQHKLTHDSVTDGGNSDDVTAAGARQNGGAQEPGPEPSVNRRKQPKQSIMKNKSDLIPGQGQVANENQVSDGEKEAFGEPLKEHYSLMEKSRKFTPSPSLSSPNISPALSPVTGKPMYSEGKKTKRRLKRCNKCGYITDNVTTLQRHMAKHGKAGKYTCPYCDYSVDKQHVVDYHIQRVHSATGDNASYASCMAPSPDNTSCGTVDLHDGAAEFPSGVGGWEMADSGDADSVDASCLKGEDVKIVHIGNRTVYGCIKCPFNSMKVSSIMAHVAHHGAAFSYTCTQCDFADDNPALVQAHLKDVHNSSNALLASNAQQESADVTDDDVEGEPKVKVARLDFGDNTAAFACDGCSFEGASAGELAEHKCLETRTCQHCDYTCTSASSMLQHEKSHAMKQPSDAGIKVNVCDRCPYRTASRAQLENHKMRHGLRSKHNCPYCDYSCGNATQQGNHVKLHFPNHQLNRDVLHLLIKGEQVPGYTAKMTSSDVDDYVEEMVDTDSRVEFDDDDVDEADDNDETESSQTTPVNGQFKTYL